MKKSYLYGVSGLVLMVSAISPAMAQSEPAEAAPAAENGEIVVTGIRASIGRALDLKRNSTEVIDAISAEDVGKFPDRNIAESLQRVTGVSIARDRGEGGFVSVRALPPAFVRGSVNGRTFLSGTESFDSTEEGATATTTGRATNFDILPSELVQTLEVKKSASAQDVEGGIGGSVNLVLAKPMKLGNSMVASARGRYSEVSGKVDPSVFLMGSYGNDVVAVIGGINYSKRSIRTDASNAFLSYHPFNFLSGINLDLDKNGKADAKQPIANLFNNPEMFIDGRERITANTAIQWQPTDDTDINFDIVYSKRKIDSMQLGTLVADTLAGTACVGSVANKDKSITCPSAVMKNGVLVSRKVDGAMSNTFTDNHLGEENSLNTGLNISQNFGEGWNVGFDVAYAQTRGSLNWLRTVFAFNQTADKKGNIFPGTIKYTENGGAFIPDAGMAALANPAIYNVRQTELRDRYNNDEEFSSRLDFTYSPEDSAISAVRFGANYMDRTKNFKQYMGADGARKDAVLPLTDFKKDAYMRAPDGFLDGKFIGVSPSDVFFPNNAILQPLRAAGYKINKKLETSSTFNTGVKTLAGYLQVDLDSTLGSLPISGNMGVRVVNTSNDVAGKLQDITIVERDGGSKDGGYNEIVPAGTISDLNYNSSYTNFLPSMNLKLDLSDKMLARFGYSRSMTRPEFVDMAPALSVTNPSNFLGSSGNPNLKPYMSDNLDLGLEYYFSQGSALTVGLFHKSISDYVLKGSATDVAVPEIGFTNAAGVNSKGVTLAVVQRPENMGRAKINGLEVGYTQLFKSLPAPLDGMGVQVNATWVDSKLTNARTGLEQSFPGVSKFSYNAALFYDNGPVQGRFAYTWRDDYLANGAASFGMAERYVKAYGQLDFSLSVEPMKNLTLFVDGVNLLNKMERSMGADVGAGELDPLRVVSATHVGRRFSFGATFKY